MNCSSSVPRPIQSGFTIVELLTAVVLASLLLVAVMGLIHTLTAKQRQLTAQQDRPAWHALAAERLRFDLANARNFEWSPRYLRLIGYAGRDFDSFRTTHRPTEVVYRVTEIGGRAWLLREERQLDVLSNANRRSEIVCAGLDAIGIDIPGDARTRMRQSGELPECVRVTLTAKSPPTPVFELFFCR